MRFFDNQIEPKCPWCRRTLCVVRRGDKYRCNRCNKEWPAAAIQPIKEKP